MYIRQYIGSSSTALCRGWVGISTCVSPTMMDIIGTNLQLYGTDAAAPRRAAVDAGGRFEWFERHCCSSSSTDGNWRVNDACTFFSQSV